MSHSMVHLGSEKLYYNEQYGLTTFYLKINILFQIFNVWTLKAVESDLMSMINFNFKTISNYPQVK